ncbi:amidohydrolase [Variovorax sp. VNK109]|uniref:amidohydrolase n=1 Tax=Variovorax sp. VNK109 TaxID=3400919 RepID=UPI003C0F5F54
MSALKTGADTIVIGNVLTMNDGQAAAEAVAISAGKVIAVGSRQAILETRTAATRVHDFGKATVIPGFNDSHAHMDGVGLKFIRPPMEGLKSIADVLARIRQLAATTPKGEWIVTMPLGTQPYYFDALEGLAEKRVPTRQELDSAAPDHPVYISSPNGFWGHPPSHSAMNSLALQRNGVTRDTKPESPHITIVKDASGEPTGQFIEYSYVSVIDADIFPAVPRFTYEDRRDAVVRAMKLYHAAGTTSVYEGHGFGPEVLSACREVWERGDMTMRMSIVVSPAWRTPEEADQVMRDWMPLLRGRGTGDAYFNVSGVFISYGGESCVTHIQHKDVSNVGWSGLVQQTNTPENFEALCMLAGKHNIRANVIISDKLHEIAPIMQRVARHFPLAERRWVMQHVSRSNAANLQVLKELGMPVTLIPPHYLWKAGVRFLDLDNEAMDYLSPAKQLHEMGVHVSAATDAVPYNPLFCMWAMTARRERTTNRLMGEGGLVSNEVALRLLTRAGAYLTFEESVKGQLAPGFYADLAVLSGNPLETTGLALTDLQCKATMVGGRWVHGESQP